MLLSMMFLLLLYPLLCGFSAVWSCSNDVTCGNAVPGALPPQVLASVSCRKEICVLHFSECPFQGAGQCRNRPGAVAGFGVTTWALEGNPGGLSKGPRNAGGTRCCMKSCSQNVVPVISATNISLFSFQVKAIYIHSDMFSVQNGLLTPTLKAKRPELRDYFKKQIEELYSSISIWNHRKNLLNNGLCSNIRVILKSTEPEWHSWNG